MAIAPAGSPLEPKIDSKKRDMEVVEAVKTQREPQTKPEVEKAKRDLLRIIKQVGIDPQRIIQAGKYAEAALKRPEMYQMAIQNAVQAGLLTPDQVPKGPGIDFQLLGSGVTAGRLTEQLIQEGKL
ncbi:hypothetical protein [Bacteriophage sp.]|nr:hypothetical protein [Bacteriophage sp.]